MSILPCRHLAHVTEQIEPAIDLLTNLDTWHPDILRQHTVEPEDYHEGLVFRSAVESIRGNLIASATGQREEMVRATLEEMVRAGKIVRFRHNKGRARYDFEVELAQNPDYFVALEVKGGEGNSINISERPIWAREFAVWSHLDGAIVNQPTAGTRSIINRLANEMVRRQKHVDVLFIKDRLCGTRLQPCPKYGPRNA